ncbi:MAG: MerR family transcriptional regulator [Deltaproteobacteria bacterium]
MQDNKSGKEGLLRISDLARETGVAVGTIKFYIREGLLPAPTLKTGRNMAYYDRSFIERIRMIKELQTKRFLPLDVIRAILDRDDAVISQSEIDTMVSLEGTFYEAIHYAPGHPPITVAEAAKRFDLEEQGIRYNIELGVLTPIIRDGEEVLEGQDLLMLECFADLQRAGIDEGFVPAELSVPKYVKAIDALAREELKMFTQAATAKVDDPAQVARMALDGLKLTERFIVLLRRKMMLRAIQELRMDAENESTGTGD